MKIVAIPADQQCSVVEIPFVITYQPTTPTPTQCIETAVNPAQVILNQ